MKRVVATLLGLFFAVVAGWASDLEVHFVDVGQGSGVVLRTEQAVVVVDAGATSTMADYLSRLGVTTVDLVVASHAHADHIGGIPFLFDRFAIGRLWYNGQSHTTRTFERFLDAILASQADYQEPERGQSVTFGELILTVLHPAGSAAEYQGHLHDRNIVIRADYRLFSVILTGDAEVRAEQEMRATGVRLRATVLQLGHHGSQTSSSAAFLRAVQPAVVVYQAGIDNSYAHPHVAVIERVGAATSAAIYGTDTHGSIVIVTDGRTYRIETARTAPPRPRVPTIAETGCVDINTASVSELTRIVHIGEQRAHQIVAERPFAGVDDLRRISGIGEARLRDIRDQGLACAVGLF